MASSKIVQLLHHSPFTLRNGKSSRFTVGKTYKVLDQYYCELHECEYVDVLNDDEELHIFEIGDNADFKTEKFFTLITED